MKVRTEPLPGPFQPDASPVAHLVVFDPWPFYTYNSLPLTSDFNYIDPDGEIEVLVEYCLDRDSDDCCLVTLADGKRYVTSTTGLRNYTQRNNLPHFTGF